MNATEVQKQKPWQKKQKNKTGQNKHIQGVHTHTHTHIKSAAFDSQLGLLFMKPDAKHERGYFEINPEEDDAHSNGGGGLKSLCSAVAARLRLVHTYIH